ncbi:spindle pole body component 110-like [Drosophila guanche]|uniref:Uncharacterized protein n=1 Tax=Drosophila guanche TaxID=7266 RepID=A0A3B0JZZ0_DROGU|nr:spindle pole body component 110-like [Drosophila guanche]SPP79269.1 Hypothetical predicted protein [Drosophila guanche]
MVESDKQEFLADGQWLMDPYQKTATKVIVRAWCKRGKDICQLVKAKDYYKHKVMESNNKLHMYKVMTEVAEDRNNELCLQLMKSKKNTIQIHSSKLSLTADKEQLQKEVDCRKRENEELKAVTDQRKTELCAARLETRRLRRRISQNELVVFKLKTMNSDLNNEVRMLRSFHRSNQLREQRLNKELLLKSELITIMQKELSLVKERIRKWNDNELKENEQQMRPLIDQLQDLSRGHSFLRMQTVQEINSRNSMFQKLWPTSLARKPQPMIEKAFPFCFKLNYILGS